jgi:hypothetical protein
MKKLFNLSLTIALLLMISGCGGNEEAIGGSDTVIQKSLKSPSSYRPVSHAVLWSGKSADGKNAYIVRTEYDAQNGFGALIRDCSYTSFTIEGEKVEWSQIWGNRKCADNVGNFGGILIVTEEELVKGTIEAQGFVSKGSSTTPVNEAAEPSDSANNTIKQQHHAEEKPTQENVGNGNSDIGTPTTTSLGWWGKLVNSVIGIRELTDENAMMEIYGNYKKNTPVGSNWLIENAPSNQKSELGKTKYVAPLTDYSYKSSESDFKVFLTYAVDLNESGLPDDCHACSVVIGSHVFKKGFLGWKQYSSEKFLAVGGSWGRPPGVKADFDSKKNLLVLHIDNSFFAQGILETSRQDISFDGKSWKSGEVIFETSGSEDEAVTDTQQNLSGSTEAIDPNSTSPNDIPVAEVPDTKGNVTESIEAPAINYEPLPL